MLFQYGKLQLEFDRLESNNKMLSTICREFETYSCMNFDKNPTVIKVFDQEANSLYVKWRAVDFSIEGYHKRQLKMIVDHLNLVFAYDDRKPHLLVAKVGDEGLGDRLQISSHPLTSFNEENMKEPELSVEKIEIKVAKKTPLEEKRYNALSELSKYKTKK